MSVSAALVARLAAIPGLRYWRQAPLAPFTTIGVGGRADLLLTLQDREAVAQALALLEEAGVAWTVVGSGSNLLVADQGYRGVVLKLDGALSYLDGPYATDGTHARLVAGAALALPRLATLAADHGLSGLEWACGIPGSLGGGVAMNAGAHGGNLGQAVEALEVATPGAVVGYAADEVEWAYRSCRLPAASVVTAVQLVLDARRPAGRGGPTPQPAALPAAEPAAGDPHLRQYLQEPPGRVRGPPVGQRGDEGSAAGRRPGLHRPRELHR